MATVQADMTKIQDLLHDAGTIWPSDELLRAYNDGYRRLLVESNAIKDFFCFDVPPRNAYTFCYEWEDSVLSGPNWKCMLGMRGGAWSGTTRWEAQQAESVVTTTGEATGITQQWERSYAGGDADRNYDLVFPKNANNPNRVRFNNRIMLPITTLELDQIHLNWPSFVGMPYWYTAGFGRVSSIEVYRIQTDYVQSYQYLYPAGQENIGLPRNWSGTRTYGVDYTSIFQASTVGYSTSADAQVLNTVRPKAEAVIGFGWRFTFYQGTDTAQSFCVQNWEADTVNAATTIRTGSTIGTYSWENAFSAGGVAVDQQLFAIGAVRGLSSTARQYVPVLRGSGVMLVTGTIREWGSSDGTFNIMYSAFPQSPLQLQQVPDLIAPQLQKYLRYYVLGEAFGKAGEGYRPDMAAHWSARFKRGVVLMRKLADVAFMDRIYVREPVGQSDNRRTPLVGLPPQYERIW